MLGIPTMVALTHAELALPLLASVYFLSVVLNLLSWKHAREYVNKYCRKEKMNQLLEKELPFLTCFRAQIMHSTYVPCGRFYWSHVHTLTVAPGCWQNGWTDRL